MSESKEFYPLDYLDREKLDQVDLSDYPELESLLSSLKNNFKGLINSIYGESSQVAELLDIPKSNITKETDIVKQWIGTVIPAIEIKEEEQSIKTLPDCAIISMGFRIINMIIEGKEREDIEALYEAFEFFKTWAFHNNENNLLKWDFKPRQSGGKMEDFANIMKIRV